MARFRIQKKTKFRLKINTEIANNETINNRQVFQNTNANAKDKATAITLNYYHTVSKACINSAALCCSKHINVGVNKLTVCLLYFSSTGNLVVQKIFLNI